MSSEDHWTEQALCAQTDPEAFFPETGTGHNARKICGTCPVRAECLRGALVDRNATPDGTLYGIWGGYGSATRAKIWRLFTDSGKFPIPSTEYIREWLDENGAMKQSGASKW